MRPDKKKGKKPYKGKGAQQQNNEGSTAVTADENKASSSQSTTAQNTVQDLPSNESNPQIKSPDVPDKNEKPTGCVLKTEEANVNPAPVTGTAETKKYSKRKVFSNWERYSEPVITFEEEQNGETDGVDFEELLKAPASGDGHFMFKSEKLEAPPSGNLFALDLKLLSTTLTCIPFYKQLDLPISYFSPSELAAMDKEAEKQMMCAKAEKPQLSLDLFRTDNKHLEMSMEDEEDTTDFILKSLEDAEKIVPIEMSKVDVSFPESPENITDAVAKPEIARNSVGNMEPHNQSPKPSFEVPKPSNELLIIQTSLASSVQPINTVQPTLQPISIQQPTLQPISTQQATPQPIGTQQTTLQPIIVPPTLASLLVEPPKGQRERKSRKSDPPKNTRSQDLAQADEDLKQLLQTVESQLTISESNNSKEKPTETCDTSSKPTLKPAEDLEAWLDSVLDD